MCKECREKEQREEKKACLVITRDEVRYEQACFDLIDIMDKNEITERKSRFENLVNNNKVLGTYEIIVKKI